VGKPVFTYDLYGEMLSGGLVDSVHYETIKERSSRHNWTIRPHKHVNLAQIFSFKVGGVSYQLGDTIYESQEPMILLIPPQVPHGFHFPETVIGDVISLQVDKLSQEIQSSSIFSDVNEPIALVKSKSTHFEQIESSIELFKSEYLEYGALRMEILQALLKVILLYIQSDNEHLSHFPSMSTNQSTSKHDDIVRRFCEMVEVHYKDQLTIQYFAESIGLSQPHLTRICRQYLKVSPHKFIKQRRILEAKRLLQYTRLSINEVSNKIGFEDPGYFCRFFKSETCATPVEYRQSISN